MEKARMKTGEWIPGHRTDRRQCRRMTEETGIFSRAGMLFGREGMERLHHARVAVFGLGGVGSYVVEALARSGISNMDLVRTSTKRYRYPGSGGP